MYLNEKNMSLKAKGLLGIMLSWPDGEEFSVVKLISMCKENGTAVRSAIKELEAFKYLKITKTHNEQGQIEYTYEVFHQPVESPK